MTRVLADPPSRSGGILTKRELEAALRVLAALRRPAPASVVMSWDNDMQDMLGNLQRVRYVESRPAYGGYGPRKTTAPFRPDMLATTELGGEYLDSIKKSSGAAHATRRGAVKKKTAAQLDREIAASMDGCRDCGRGRCGRSHATKKQPPRVAYRIQLTPSELKAIEFARGRYAWPDMLAAHAMDNGLVAFTESEMWQWTDDVDSDAEGGHSPFPLAAPAFAAKLQRFYDERI